MNIQHILGRIRWNAEGGESGSNEPPPAETPPAGSAPDGSNAAPAGDENTPPPSWLEALSPENKQLAETKGWTNPSDVLGGYAELEKIIGTERIALPGENATQEELDKFFTALGRPETPDKYDLGDFAPPEGVPWDAEGQQAAMSMFHSAGMNSQQVQTCLKFEAQRAATMQAAIAKLADDTAEATTTAFQKKWGADYAANMDMANIGLRQLLGNEDATLVDAFRGLRNAKGEFIADTEQAVELFRVIGKAYTEPHALPGLGTSSGAITSPAGAKAELDKLRADESFQKILRDASHPEHSTALERKNRLYKVAFPKGGK